jgi:hypothetical protein
MPKFQSRLFNWIEQSLPVRLGRNARKLIDRALDRQLEQITELPKLIAYQTARAALYPVYLLTKTTKKALRKLQKTDNWELIESEKNVNRNINSAEIAISLPEAGLEIDLRSEDTLENPSPTPFLLRPLSRLINWVEQTKLKIDQKIDQSMTAIARISRGNVVEYGDLSGDLSDDPNNLDINQAEQIANQLFSKIWEQEVEKRIGKTRDDQINQKIVKTNSIQDLTKVDEDNSNNRSNYYLNNDLNNDLDQLSKDSLYQKFTLGKNNKLEELRKLIEAAIAYFFGESSNKVIDQNIDQDTDKFLNYDFPPDQALNLKPNQSPAIKANNPKLLSNDQPINPSQSNQEIKENNSLNEINQLALNSNLEKLRQLIAAAIDYFIGKRSLTSSANNSENIGSGSFSNQPNNSRLNNAIANPQLESESTLENIPSTNDLTDSANQGTSNIANEFQDSLQIDQQLERLRKLIEQAIAYFFDKQRSRPTLDETNDLTTTTETWLTMEDVFGDDHGPWPLPLEYESPAFAKSINLSNSAAINSSGELQNFETTTSQIYQDRLEGSLYFVEEEESRAENASDRPLRAWLEAKATLWGYAVNPVMDAIFWLDQVILKIENLLIALWKKWVKLIKSIFTMR